MSGKRCLFYLSLFVTPGRYVCRIPPRNVGEGWVDAAALEIWCGIFLCVLRAHGLFL